MVQRLLALSACLLVLACSSDSPTGDHGGNRDDSFSANVDGTTFAAPEWWGIHAEFTPNPGRLLITGEGLFPKSFRFTITVSGVTGTGTYQFDQVTSRSGSVAALTITSGPDSSVWTTAVAPSTGSLTITKWSTTHAEGTFSFTAAAAGGTSATGTKSVTNGKFSVNF